MQWAIFRDAMADLYPDQASIERVFSDALLETRYMNFEGKPVDIWDRNLREANNRGKLHHVVKVVLREYRDNVAARIADGILESGGRLRETPPVIAANEERESPPMPMDERDQQELRNLRKNQHDLRDEVQKGFFDFEKRWIPLTFWQERIEKEITETREEIAEMREEIALLRQSTQTYISTRWVLLAIVVFMLILSLGIWYLETRPSTLPTNLPTEIGGIFP